MTGEPLVGRSLVSVLEDYRAGGFELAYSSRVVSADLVVREEPTAHEALGRLRQMLAEHQLTLRRVADVLLVVPAPRDAAPSLPTAEAPPEQIPIENITVSASRYEISRDAGTSRFRIDRRSIESLPDIADDPIRATHRLPGAAASGASARVHFRGGEEREVGIFLNGLELLDPFHVRDYQNIFSAVDSRAVDGVEVYTGGFPVRYGDRTSGLVLMESMRAEQDRYTEIGLSVFNTSLLTTGSEGSRRWLVSARRGNLDLVIDPEYGSPKYYDMFAALSFDVSPVMSITFNGLYADDRVSVVVESEPAEREAVSSRTRNAQAWVGVDNEWSSALESHTVFSLVSYQNLRNGFIDDVEKLVATVRDERELSEWAVRQDWTYSAAADHSLQWGISVASGDAYYDYASSASYFNLQALYQVPIAEGERRFSTSPSGSRYSVYVADRWSPRPGTSFEVGVRWDDQTYTQLESSGQFSPRFMVLHRLGSATEFRLALGRYYQSQGIHELQVEDGITRFWPAQRADHAIASIRHHWKNGLSIRVEAFRKSMRQVRPRFENLYDPLSVLPELQPDRVFLEPEKAEAYGIELSANAELGAWSIWGQYTYSRAVDRILGRDELRSWDQRHAAQAGITWTGNGWVLSAAASAHTGWPATDLDLLESGVDESGEPTYEAVPGQRNALRYPGFASLDVRFSKTFDVPRGELTAFLEVSNLTDRKNVCCTDWDLDEDVNGNPVLERSEDYWLPLLPAIGVLWKF